MPTPDVGVAAYTVPTEQPESDGTLDWDSVTLVWSRRRPGGDRDWLDLRTGRVRHGSSRASSPDAVVGS